ncbi:hypothetical protein MWH06_05400 [Wolbachia pipientis]|nr:hypothetical protein MWH06_05400 [Wolbachia pipientis]
MKNIVTRIIFEVIIQLLAELSINHGALGDDHKKKQLEQAFLSNVKRHYGYNHFQAAITIVNLINTYGALGDRKKQKELITRTLSIFKKHRDSNHPEVAKLLAELDDI